MNKYGKALSGLLTAVTAACSSMPDRVDQDLQTPVPHATAPAADVDAPVAALSMNQIATDYVRLVLAMGELDPDYVDAYYGPAAWREEVKQHQKTLPKIQMQAEQLAQALDSATTDQVLSDAELPTLRKAYLRSQLSALAARARLLQGEKRSFDEEAQALYDVTPPHYVEADFAPALKRIDRLVPHGEGTLADRYNRYIEKFAVPKDKLESVMRAAIAEARLRTVTHMPIAQGEHFELAFVTGKPWSAYNWYQGNFVSRIEVNTELPIPVSRVIELASHEGYPGHHIYNGLLEDGLVRDLGWPEYQVYALFSPQSLIAEGSADYGVGLAFPGKDKLAFTRDLFKLAGFDRRQAAAYLQVVNAARALAPATIEAARRYLDGKATADETIAWLQQYTLASPDRAKQRLAFINRYRSYIINYSYGEDLVRNYVERRGGKIAGSDHQWQAFFSLLSQPHTPADLAGEPAR